MDDVFLHFETIARKAWVLTEARDERCGGTHPFEERDIHPNLANIVRELFDNGHYSQATFEAFKFLDKEVQRHSSEYSKSGKTLMMLAFSETAPLIRLTPLSNTSERDEQQGFKFIFSGSTMAIRNPRGHEVNLPDSPDKCLDHLSLASLLLRRMEESGFK